MDVRPCRRGTTLVLTVILSLLAPSMVRAKKRPVLTPLVQRARTVLVQVDVRVEDARGQPVRGLTAKDFILVVDGSVRDINTFDEIITVAPTGHAADRGKQAVEEHLTVSPSYFVFFFDNVLSNQFERRLAGQAADQVLRDVLRPEDRFTVVAMGQRLKVLSQMTRVRDRGFGTFSELLGDPDTIDSYADERGSREADVLEQYQADPELGRHQARSYAVMEGNRVHKLLEVVRNLLTALEPIRERKMLLYFSAGVPERPGAQYLHLAELDDEIIKGTRTTLFQMERLFREANSGRVSIFPVDVAGLDTGFSIHQGPPSIDLLPGIPSRLTTDYSHKRDGLVSLALNTGGKAILNTNDLGGTLQDVVKKSQHYYLLGFTPPSGGDGKYHKIHVRMWDSRWKVTARSGFMDFNQSQFDRRQILGSFMLPEMFAELPLKLEVVPLERRGGKWLADAQVRLPAAALDRLPQGDGSYGQIEVGFSLFRGATLAYRFDRALTLQFPSRLPQAEIILQQTVEMKPGDYRGIAVARDTVSGKVGSVSVDFELPAPRKQEVRVGMGRLAGKDVLNTENDRYLAPQRPVVWNAPGEETFRSDAVLVFAYLLPGEGAQPPWITHRVLRDGELVRTSHPSLKPVGRKGRDLATYEEIVAADLGPGRYSLRIVAGRGSATLLAEVDFRVMGNTGPGMAGGTD
jgi:VWFA-related protein